MAHPVMSKCPLCASSTQVSEVSCTQCDMQMRGKFTLSRYDSLSPEQGQFLEAFLRCRGVIRDVEAALGISYPTVRARLDTLLTPNAAPVMTAAEAEAAEKAARRREILAAISAGTLDAEAGLDALQSL